MEKILRELTMKIKYKTAKLLCISYQAYFTIPPPSSFIAAFLSLTPSPINGNKGTGAPYTRTAVHDQRAARWLDSSQHFAKERVTVRDLVECKETKKKD